MEEEIVPFFEDALRAAEERLSAALGGKCDVRIVLGIDKELFDTIQQIEREKFRPELRYSIEELEARRRESGLVLFFVIRDGRVVAFLYGYTESSDTSKFYLDTMATLIEGKGVGSILVSLMLLYCYDMGYGSVELYTEEEDEKGRRLADFYENLGFKKFSDDPSEGVGMRNSLEPKVLRDIYHKYLHKTGTIKDLLHPR